MIIEFFKLNKSKGLNLRFEKASMAESVCDKGIFCNHLFFPGYRFVKDKFIMIPSCMRCYAIDSHNTAECPMGNDFKV